MSTFTNQELNRLYRFQEAQRQLALLHNQLTASPLQEEIDALSLRWNTERERTRLLQEEIDVLTKENRQLETECQDLDYQLAQIEKSLYSGKISSPKELEQLQKRNSEYKNAREKREDKLLNQLYLLEELEKQGQRAQEQVAELKKKLAMLEAEEATRVKALRTQIREVKEELADLETLLPDGLKTFYQRSAKTLKGSVLAPVKEGTCGSCHMIISQAVIEKVKAGGPITFCENCGRGLFIPESSH